MRAVAVFAPMYPPAFRGGGPVRSVHALVKSPHNDAVTWVLTRDTDKEQQGPLPVPRNSWIEHEGVPVRYVSVGSVAKYLVSLLSLHRKRPDALYFNSFFNLHFSIIPQLLWRIGLFRGAKRLVAVRGEFGEEALRIKSRKKHFFLGVYRSFLLHREVVWHASSVQEADDIYRLFGKNASILVRSNETLLPPRAYDPVVTDRSRAKVAFLGRIVPIKGLDLVLRALSHTQEGLDIDIYGPEQDAGYARHCRDLVRHLPPEVLVSFRGPIAHEQVRETLSNYDALLMPTAGENFGQVIAEALSVSLPVVAMDVTPWTDTLHAGGGVIVRKGSEAAWQSAVEALCMASPQERLEMRLSAGRAFEAWQQDRRPGHVFGDFRHHLSARSKHLD